MSPGCKCECTVLGQAEPYLWRLVLGEPKGVEQIKERVAYGRLERAKAGVRARFATVHVVLLRTRQVVPASKLAIKLQETNEHEDLHLGSSREGVPLVFRTTSGCNIRKADTFVVGGDTVVGDKRSTVMSCTVGMDTVGVNAHGGDGARVWCGWWERG